MRWACTSKREARAEIHLLAAGPEADASGPLRWCLDTPIRARAAAGGGNDQHIQGRGARNFDQASDAQLAQLNERSWSETDRLAIYIDGIVIDRRHIVAAIGVDDKGSKRLLGLSSGGTENATVCSSAQAC